MSSSIKREVSHDPREIQPRQRRLSILNEKHPASHSRKSSTSTEAKISKIVKSSSSTEKDTLETLYSPNIGSPRVIKNHEDSENSKSKSSSKMFFSVSLDLSPGIERLFDAVNLCDNSKSLIISINQWLYTTSGLYLAFANKRL
jgi:hypothetical protein